MNNLMMEIRLGLLIIFAKISLVLYGEKHQKIRELGGFSYIYPRMYMYHSLGLTRYLYIRIGKIVFYLLYCVVCIHRYMYVNSPNFLISGIEISSQYGENTIFLKT